MKPKSSRRFLISPQLRSFNVALTFASKPLLLAVACSLGAVSLSQIASAEFYTYDADTATPGPQDGSGLGWDTTSANWLLDGLGSNVAWPNLTTDKATFGAGGTIATAAAGTVTVGTVNVGTISFPQTTTTGYTLTGGTITIGEGIEKTSTLTTTINSKISGAAGLDFQGVVNATTGVTLNGANDYTGVTSASTGGRITAGSATALGSTAGATATTLGDDFTQVNSGATVAVAVSTAEAFLISSSGSAPTGTNPAGGLRLTNTVALSSLIQLGGAAQISGNFGTNTLSGNLDLAGFTLGVGNGNNSVTLNLSGLLVGVPPSILDIGAGGGSNVVNLNNPSNLFSGIVRVNASSGTSFVGLPSDTALGSSTLVFAGGGVRSTNATARTIVNTIGEFTGSANFGATATQTGTLNFTYNAAPVSLGLNTRTLTTNVNTTIAAAFSNIGGLTKAGLATLFLTNTTSTRTGTTTINAGNLNVASLANGGVGNPSSIGESAGTAGTLVLGGGTLQYTGTTPQTTDRLFTVAASAAVPPTSSGIDASGSSGASLVFANAGAIGAGDVTRVVNLPIQTTTVTGLTSTANLKVGARVTGTNIATTPTATTIASITNGTTIVLSQATTNTAVANNVTLTFSSVDRSLALTGNNTDANSIAGILSDRTVATFPTGVLSLSKTGTGTWTLGGLNTYTGNTTVTGGILQINQPYLADTADVIIAQTAKLNLNFDEIGGDVQDTVNKLTINNLEKVGGKTYGATGSGAEVIDDVYFSGPGVLFVTTGVASGDYDVYLSSFSPAINGADRLTTADPDKDGLTNQREYAFGLVPNSGSSVNPISVQLNKTNGKFRYTRRTVGLPSPALVYTVETSTNLTLWTVDAGATQAVAVAGTPVETVEVTVSPALLANPSLFVRVVAN